MFNAYKVKETNEADTQVNKKIDNFKNITILSNRSDYDVNYNLEDNLKVYEEETNVGIVQDKKDGFDSVLVESTSKHYYHDQKEEVENNDKHEDSEIELNNVDDIASTGIL